MENLTAIEDDKTCALGKWLFRRIAGRDHWKQPLKGYIFPLIDETNMPLVVRCIIYFIGLIWSFLGVAIVADIFMCAIEGQCSNLVLIVNLVFGARAKKSRAEKPVKYDWELFLFPTIHNWCILFFAPSTPQAPMITVFPGSNLVSLYIFKCGFKTQWF